MKRKTINSLLVVGIALCICVMIFTGKTSEVPTSNTTTEANVTTEKRCKINDKSLIVSDLELLNM